MSVNTRDALALVKHRLNRLPGDTSLDTYLGYRINAAIEELERTGITLDDGNEDLLLVVDMTVWQYQNRDSGAGMPEWLRLRRRERWLQQNREAAGDDS
jgi:hypothetical protein